MNNIWMTWGDIFNASLQDLWYGLVQFAPKFILAVVFFILGWILGGIVGKAIEQVFAALKVDKLFASIGAEGFFRKAGMNLNTGRFVGELVRWFVVIVFLLSSLSLVGLGIVGGFLATVVLGYLPHVVVAVLVLVIAAFIAEFLSKAVVASVKTVSLSSAHMMGTIVKYSVWVFALIMALGELGVAEYYMNVLFTGVIAMLALGGALAFGLGGRDAASRFIDKVSGEMADR